MFAKRLRLFSIYGIDVAIDLSWFLVAILIVWSLASGLFPTWYGGLPTSASWAMGVVGALGLFAAIVFHELAHALVARHYGVTIHGITLFLFGGVAEMEDETTQPGAEFSIAIVGPLASLLLALACYAISLVGWRANWPLVVTGVTVYLATINTALAIFNLVPAFPLDGGRLLRSLLWRWKGDRLWATHVSAQIGNGFGVFLIVLGVVSFLANDIIGAIWWVLLGVFLRNAANMAYQQLRIQQLLADAPVRQFMEARPITVPASIAVAELVNNYIYTYRHPFFPVVEDGRLVGSVSTRQVKQLPPALWSVRHVADIAEHCSATSSVPSDMDARQVLATMQRTGATRLLVVDGDRLAGIITLADLLRFCALKTELERLPT